MTITDSPCNSISTNLMCTGQVRPTYVCIINLLSPESSPTPTKRRLAMR